MNIRCSNRRPDLKGMVGLHTCTHYLTGAKWTFGRSAGTGSFEWASIGGAQLCARRVGDPGQSLRTWVGGTTDGAGVRLGSFERLLENLDCESARNIKWRCAVNKQRFSEVGSSNLHFPYFCFFFFLGRTNGDNHAESWELLLREMTFACLALVLKEPAHDKYKGLQGLLLVSMQ